MDKSVITIAIPLVVLLLTALGSVMWYLYVSTRRDIRRLEADVIALREQMNSLKFNYLDRFDSLKSQISQMDLCFTEKLVKLTTLLETYLVKKGIKENE